MGKLTNLLRWKKRVTLTDRTGEPLKDEKGNPVIVWVRIIGDEDQQEAYRMSRIKSYEVRMKLRDESTPDYKDTILPIQNAAKEVAIELVRASRGNNFTAEALANVERPELPTLAEIAIDPDAPTLEEQEKVDQAVLDTETKYQEAVQEYIKTRVAELEAELEAMSLEDIRKEAMVETANAMALSAFLTEVQDEKVWRAIYQDEACTKRAVDSVEEFRALHSTVKAQLINAYNDLELSPDEIKN